MMYEEEAVKASFFCPVTHDLQKFVRSVAILKYLATKYNVPDHWYPRTNIQEQARVEEYMNWQNWNTRLNAANLFRKMLLEPQALNRPVNWKRVSFLRKEVEKSIIYMDKVWLKDRLFLSGNDISVADILGVCELMQLHGVHEEKLYECNPAVTSWMKRSIKRLQPHFDEAHKTLFIVREEYPKIAQQLAKL